MDDTFEPEDGVTARLRALGQMPVDRATQSAHLTAMAEAAAAPSLFGTFGNRLRVGLALLVGFMLGTTGLASANALGPLQPIAKKAIEAATPLNVPGGEDAGTERYRGAECEAVEYRNHGQYIKAVREAGGDVEAAAASRCGMPIQAGADDDENGDVEATEGTEDEEGEGKGNGKAKAAEAKARAAEAKARAGEAKANGAPEEPGKAEAACAGGAGNGVDGPVEDAQNGVTPTTGKPDCAEEQSSTGGEDENGTETEATETDTDDVEDTDEGKPAGAGGRGADQRNETPAAGRPDVAEQG